MKIKLLSPTAKIPARATIGASGFDAYSDRHMVLAPGALAAVPLGFACALPLGYELQVRPRSGLAVKLGVETVLGTVDSEYRGEVSAIVVNRGADPFEINVGDRIAQCVVMTTVPKTEITVVESLDETERGAGAFGHTGMRELPAPAVTDPVDTTKGEAKGGAKSAPTQQRFVLGAGMVLEENRAGIWVVRSNGRLIASTAEGGRTLQLVEGAMEGPWVFAAQQTLNQLFKK